MNSRWQASKIGLINFWYYDEQEFPFAKGRMLLRGANGSGKSVTMQSVIPLLLDGNMSPERLDPFGSRDRKMSSYLLEEDDGRDERTGYLYLELKRQESSIWLTIGMGIRARRGKPLDKWYFSLTDGRRIGKDFWLYKETGEKVPLSRKELENRIGNGGQVFDRQTDYMDYVNQQVFGFETLEEYKEMIDLLIQLRTPKLSKDFKPSVVNDILSDSLQPLSDEDLRPMSEAIENMDTMNMNLKSREAGYQAAGKIQKVLDRYNRLILFGKAQRCVANEKMQSSLEKEIREQVKQMQSCKERMETLEQEKSRLDARRDAMEKERESLSKSDAVSLKARQMDLEFRMKAREKLLEEKKSQIAAKQEQYVATEDKKKKEENREYEKEKELGEILDEMQTEAEEMAFEEHAFFQEEVKRQLHAELSWDTHKAQFEKTADEISRGTSLLKETQVCQKEADDLLKKWEKQQRETDTAKRRENELEGVMIQIENEWKEALYSWNGRNTELKFTPQQMQELARFADEYTEGADFARVRKIAADLWIGKNSEMNGSLLKMQEEFRELEKIHQEILEELKQWEAHKEPEPPRSDAVIKNRERLKEAGIPYVEFYKVVEFGKDLEKEVCDQLEEALLAMGILDALIVEEQYREQVLKTDPGCEDRYLFVPPHYGGQSLLDVLDLNDSVNDIFFNQRVTGILGNIGFGLPENADGDLPAATRIYPDGSYQIGVISGTVAGEHEAGFIGVKAREKNRRDRIAACKDALACNEEAQKNHCGEIEELKKRIARLEKEYQGLPGDTDLREAARMLSDARRTVERMKEEGARLEEELLKVHESLKELKRQAVEIAQKLYLTCSLEVFCRAEEAARNYRQYFYQLKSAHELYLQIRLHLEELREQLENLDGDLDQIRYEQGNTQRELKKEQEEYDSVLEQLKLTDYEQIRQRLDECMAWLQSYPALLQSCVEERAQNRERIRVLQEQSVQNEERLAQCRRRGEYLARCFEAERDLKYVALPEETAVSAQKVEACLQEECRDLDLGQIIRNLNQVYFENRGFLTDYQIMQTELFEELSEEAQQGDPPAKRLDIAARYQGVRIPFGRLLVHLEEEIAQLKDLIRDGDRELFEDILANTVSRKIRGRINGSNAWVDKMNALMEEMNTSSGLKLSLRWRSRTAETEEQLDTRELVELLKKDYRLMREEEAAKLSAHFRSKVEEARRHARDSGGMISFYQVMKETLDYRKWFEFQLFFQKSGEKVKELTNSMFGTFSGGEKAMAMYVPLFSAVVAKYDGGRSDAPRLISLDEAFAGVDNRNIRDMFRLMTEFQFDFIINSQVLWGDCDTLDALAIYQLLRPENAKFVTVMPYLWNGHTREMLEDESEVEQRAEKAGNE
ncbi:MAG TPA: TIGR02680 family protein [Candidatus Ruminococcus avistercoris]|nr:TIGR02680 family protein [Candidatus Ruminococcus avistercoris]